MVSLGMWCVMCGLRPNQSGRSSIIAELYREADNQVELDRVDSLLLRFKSICSS